jgi:hypothetical protein
MSKNARTIETKRPDIMARLCADAAEICSETEPDDVKLFVDGITVRKTKPEDDEDLALLVECGHGSIALNGDLEVAEFITLLAKVEALADLDAGGPFNTFSGTLNTVHFSATWDAEFNVAIAKPEGE